MSVTDHPTIETPNIVAVLKAARKAFSEGRLQIQAPNPGEECRYSLTDSEGKTYCCAIGAYIQEAGIYDDRLEGVNFYGIIGKGLGSGKIVSHEEYDLNGLQRTHDNGVNNIAEALHEGGSAVDGARAHALAEFEKHLTRLEKDYHVHG